MRQLRLALDEAITGNKIFFKENPYKTVYDAELKRLKSVDVRSAEGRALKNYQVTLAEKLLSVIFIYIVFIANLALQRI